MDWPAGATLLRDAIRTLIGTKTNPDGEPLRRLWNFYRQSLMSDMDADDFADTYAQTLIYALFLARLEKGPMTDLEAAWKRGALTLGRLRTQQ